MSSQESDMFKPNFKEKIDMSQIWLSHVNRVNLASGNIEGLYDPYVRQQLRLLPSNYQQWIIDQEDIYSEDKPKFDYLERHGRKLGSETDPLLFNDLIPVKRLEDGSIDWNDPNIKSPKRKFVKDVDYEKFNLLIMIAAERAGLSWNVEVHGYDLGDVPKETKKKRDKLQVRTTDSGKKLPIIPGGYDTKIISTIPNSDYDIIDWNGTQFVQGLGYGPVFFDLVQARTNKGTGTIIGSGGAPGDGKTWFVERIGEILNRAQPRREFNPYIQIPFTQEHFLWLLDKQKTPLKPGDVIILDEAHFAAGARNWFKEDQKELVDLIASARNMGFVIILVVLHMSMLDNILRNFTMAFYIHLESPGSAIAYRTFTPRFSTDMIKVRIGELTLQVPWVADCDSPECLKCLDMSTCCNGRAIYERRKSYFQQLKIKQSQERRKQKQLDAISDNDKLDLINKFHNELTLTSHGNIENTMIQHILTRELGLEVGKTKSRELAKMYKLRFPDAEYITNG